MTHLEIEAFLAICKHKTISKAASELFISQSTLSERLKTLEGKLNHTLLLRRKGIREITLTPEGHTFYKLALQFREGGISYILEDCHLERIVDKLCQYL